MVQLLAITTSFPRGPADPAGHFVEGLASALRPHGFDTRVVALAQGEVGALTTLEHGTWADRAALTGRVVGAAPRALADADLVLAHWLVPSAWFALLRPGRPIVGVAHGSDARLLARLPTALREATVASLAGVIAVSAEVARTVGHPRTLVTPMGTATYAGQVTRTPRAAAGEVLEALFVGRLVPSKGLDVVIRATEGLPDVRLTVIGDGPERPRYGRHDGVRFVGACGPAAVRDAMAQAHVLCVPSVGPEGAPMVVQEAASVGLPVLASRIGGLPDVVPEAALVAPGDVAAWRAALLRAARGDVPAAPVLTWDAVAGRVAGFLHDVLARSGGGGARR